jgi:hypothetical protein
MAVPAATAAGDAVQAGQTPAKNLIVNPYFTVNNGNAGTAYVSGATLAAGTYGHEMWKAGASGGDYSFTQNSADTTITIAANKTLIQTIPPENLGTTSYVLSWTGTALARAAVNTTTPSGSFVASPIIITGQTISATGLCIEFGNGASTGTLADVTLINGSVPMAAARKTSQEVLIETQRFAWLFAPAPVTTTGYGTGQSPTTASTIWKMPVTMRAQVVLAGTSAAGTFLVADGSATVTCNVIPIYVRSDSNFIELMFQFASGIIAFRPYTPYNGGGMYLLFTSRF